MSEKEDNTGKMEVAVRVLGNELIALKMVVDDFKIKWLIYGVVTIVALGWAASSFGPALVGMVVVDQRRALLRSPMRSLNILNVFESIALPQ